MLVYWIIFLILALGALFYRADPTRRTRLAIIVIAAFPILLMVGFRKRIGPDWGSYLQIFYFTHLTSLSQALSHGDPAYYVLNWFLADLGAPFSAVTFLCALVFVAGLTAFCLRMRNPWLTLLVAFPYLVIVVSMSGIRQSVAIGLLFFALNHYEKGRLFRAIAFTVMAAFFHASAMLMAPLFTLSYSRNRLQSIGAFLAVGVVAGYLLLGSFGMYADRYSNVAMQSTGTWYRLAMNGIPALIFLCWQNRFSLPQHLRLLWRNMALASLILVPIAVIIPSNTAVDRVILYLFPLQFFVLASAPYVFGHNDRARAQLMLLVVGYAALIQIGFLQLARFRRFYVPYHSMLETDLGLRPSIDRPYRP